MAVRGSKVWKMNIGRGHNTSVEQTLCCPYCEGEGWIKNPGWELRIRRQEAGLNQHQFSKISGWGRTSIQMVERGLRKPDPHLIEEYRKLKKVNQY